MNRIKNPLFWLAVAVTLAFSIAAKYTATLPYAKVIGHLVLALIIGMLFQLTGDISKKVKSGGTNFISGKFLRAGIILMGFKLNLQDLISAGPKSLALAVFVVVFTIFLVYSLCRLFKVEEKLSILTGCGCGICGAAAVMGVKPSLKANEDDSVLAIAVISILGTVFTLISVLLHPVLGFTEQQYGVLSGGALHEIAHAVAAGSAGGPVALKVATITKLSRVLMLAPVSLIISIIAGKKEAGAAGVKTKVYIPWFVLGFIATSVLGTYVLNVYPAVVKALTDLAFIILGMAMAALGIDVNFKVLKERGLTTLGAAFIGSAILYTVVAFIAKFFF